MADKYFETSKFHQGMWNHYIMLGFGFGRHPCNAISNLELRRSYKALQSLPVLPFAATLSNICRREYAPTVDEIKKQMTSRNKVRFVLDG